MMLRASCEVVKDKITILLLVWDFSIRNPKLGLRYGLGHRSIIVRYQLPLITITDSNGSTKEIVDPKEAQQIIWRVAGEKFEEVRAALPR